MKHNMGKGDRIARLLLAAIMIILYVSNTVTGTLGIIFLVVAGIFILTSLIGFCPLYAIFGFKTCPAGRSDSGESE